MELGPGPAGNPGMSGRPGPRGEGGDMGPPVCTSLIYQQRWQARPDLCIFSLGQAPCYKSAEGRCRRQRPEAVIIP